MGILIISTKYDKKLPDYELLSTEVNLDNETIKELFPSHFELWVPAGQIPPKEIYKLLPQMKQVTDLILANGFNSVKIALNTHGVPGKYDLCDEVVLKTVQFLSAKRIKIECIYALVCDAFTINSKIHQQRKIDAMATFASSTTKCNKPSKMSILQCKLNKLTAEMEQSFDLIGFNKPYDPMEDEDEVIALLQHSTKAQTLSVNIKKTVLNQNQINEAIKILKTDLGKEDDQITKRKVAINTLAMEINRRKGNIKECIDAGDEPEKKLDPTSLKLYKAVVSSQPRPRNSHEYHQQHKIWNKTHRFKTTGLEKNQKLNIFTDSPEDNISKIPFNK